MSKIHVLDQNIANKIAAGEVVERPGSVIKELVENALDAGAKNITVEIKNGGVTYMRVTDDGCGMSKEDAKTCFLRHATSKIEDILQLYAVRTLGFRGEALAAISAVSKIELITSTGEGPGTRVKLEAGTIVSESEVGAPKGTTIIVTDLFYNVPARMKFLKTDRTEAGFIATLMDRLALSDASVSFKLIQDGRQTLCTYGKGNLQDTIYAVFGKEISHSLLRAESRIEPIHVFGYVSEPTVSRSNRNHQLCFINGRLVKSQTATAAIDQAYKNSMFHGRYPVTIIKVNVPAGFVDVNVHPNKMEVKFTNEKLFFEAVYYAVKNALNKQTMLKQELADMLPKRQPAPVPATTPEVRIADPYNAVSVLEKPEPIIPAQNETKEVSVKEEVEEKKVQQSPQTVAEQPVSLIDITNESEKASDDEKKNENGTEKAERSLSFQRELPDGSVEIYQVPFDEVTLPKSLRDELPAEGVREQRRSMFNLGNAGSFYEGEDDGHVNRSLEILKKADALEDQKEKMQPLCTKPGYRYIGEIFSTYLLMEYKDNLYIIDKHAAHERMIFERIQRVFDSTERHGQNFLVPERIRLTPEEVAFAVDHYAAFDHIGFDIDAFGDKQIILRSRPICMSPESASAAFCEILNDWMKGGCKTLTDMENTAMKRIACKAAIKGGNENDDEELKSLLADLIERDDIHQCPHGRPILVTHTKKSIEKSFKRI